MDLLVQREMDKSDCAWNVEAGSKLGADGERLGAEHRKMVQ
jgi:hypothetical protein